ncbi:MAG: adenylate/guanylate cyclase domain-containing protein [Saprospiraceae bacterium]|nr:adenylate/guanylate cyclase domain-containing protein [Saprospiraceae bacterium]MCF8248749.1 adenylate/guanylate cyclase domain-containing protein [Saprospiraceae bacterium]MCF8278761.1 adenylate/guanylate cyclase domain-containing protein [Bacteroidales bacterium]MCF8310561.1 adenylate/guanylate cyclase domain-containing protein [Saprospiraceae bacterium]MCF8439120.1 adenylate/guanylate cyclase domain-containing protein [Saprospiraceae bacterium]
MTTKEFLIDVNSDVNDILNTNFEFGITDTQLVPSYEDPSLTFENGRTKKGKTIETCVLFVDIRNSVALVNSHQKETMGKLYTAFIKAMLSAVDFHNGFVRNIIGDRVMGVFPKDNCFTNAVDCAISINTIATRIINKHFKLNEFKCGIGIDYGNMLVLKTGIIKQGKDRTAYKNLVWIGRPANVASRLTDLANKETKKLVYKVRRNPENPNAWRPKYAQNLGRFGHLRMPLIGGEFERVPGQPLNLSSIEEIEMSPEEFANSIWQYSVTGEISTLGGKMLSFEKKEITTTNSPILMTEAVYNGFKSKNLNRKCITQNYWTEKKIQVKDYSGKVFGGEVYWLAMDEITI